MFFPRMFARNKKSKSSSNSGADLLKNRALLMMPRALDTYFCYRFSSGGGSATNARYSSTS
jgi:hypothetical protein